MEERITLLQSSNLFVPVQCATVPRLGVHRARGKIDRSSIRFARGISIERFHREKRGRVVGFRGCLIENRDSFGEILVEMLYYKSS